MDSFELNKMLGAFLGVVFIVFSVTILSDTIFSTDAPDTPGYHIEVVEDEPAAPADEEEAIDVPALLAQADTSNGETAFRRCASCHSTEEGQNRVGPHLWDLVGREVATVDGFSYSGAMSEYGADGTIWGYENLFHYLQDPRAYVPGTTMAFAGLGNDQENADLIAFLREQSDDPEPLPEPTPAEEEVAAEDEAAEQEADVAAEPAEPAEDDSPLAAMFAQADTSNGQTVFRRCASCHATEEGQNRVGPHLWDIVGREVASIEGFNYSNAMEEYGAEGAVWDFENLFNYFEDPRGYVPGTNMAFAGLNNEQDNVDLIAFLNEQSDEPAALPDAGADAAPAEDVVDEEAAEEPVEQDAAQAEPAETDMAAEDASGAAALIAAGDSSAGETVFRRCSSCHALEEGQNRVGPHLWDIVGREVASVDDFNYSSAMEEYGTDGTVWDYDNLLEYLDNPRDHVPGTSMAFAGLNEADNANLLAFLREQSDDPAPLDGNGAAAQEDNGASEQQDDVETEAEPVEPAPEDDGTSVGPEPDAGVPAEEAPAEEEEEDAAVQPAQPAEADSELAAIFTQADAAAGETVFRRCAACHTTDEGVNRVGPHLWDIVGREVASVEGFNYSGPMEEYGADATTWEYQNLFDYLDDPRNYVPGTTMVFPGLGEEDNANLIAFLREQSDDPAPLPGAD